MACQIEVHTMECQPLSVQTQTSKHQNVFSISKSYGYWNIVSLLKFQCATYYMAITSETVCLLLRWTHFMSRFLVVQPYSRKWFITLACVRLQLRYLEHLVLTTWTWPHTAKIISLLSPSKRPVASVYARWVVEYSVLLVSSDRCPSLRLPP